MSAGGQTRPAVSSSHLKPALVLYVVLLAAFWFIARHFQLGAWADYPVSTFFSFAVLFAPYWFFGFGVAGKIRELLQAPWARISAAALLALPYFILEAPRPGLQWQMGLALVLIPIVVAAALEFWSRPANLADLFVLAGVGLLIDLGLLNTAWPFRVAGIPPWPPGLGGFPKMMMANIALYGYLVVKPIGGVGYCLRPKWSDLKHGLREFAFYAPIVLTLGFLLKFISWHGRAAQGQEFPAAWIFTFFLVALPEELFFRGLAQNLLERHLGKARALGLASILFGLSHFNKGAVFNWHYVLLATIAGVFYGRAWLAERRLVASSITHATVDTVWSIWFR
ncbi:MAG TPA: CPBP family intramembrane glutamic endopeptidase [Terriglobales bacterium]|nr:CPBP family intramembrane glutamic endopeptidase [Terriglobales bacterium]